MQRLHRRRGSHVENRTSKRLTETTVEGKRVRKKISYTFDLDEESESGEDEEKNEKSSDEDFKIDEKSLVEEEEEEEEEDDDEVEAEDNTDDLEIVKKATKSKISSKRSFRNSPENSFIDDATQDDDDEDDTPLLEVFDMSSKVEKWEHVLDAQTKSFKRPKIPRLSDDAIKPFISSKSIPPKTIIYDCPFCARIFTYTLVFKSHLFICDSNTNTPNYNILCGKHPECEFKRKKKSEVVQHFIKAHISGKRVSEDDEIEDEELYYKTQTKQNQLEVSRYYFIDKNIFNFTLDYFRNYLNGNYKNLKFIDTFFTDNKYEHTELKIENKREPLHFKLNKIDFNPKPFEIFEYKNKADHFKIVNVCSQITCLDWCPTIFTESRTQFLAFANTLADFKKEFSVKKIFDTKNFIYILKFIDLNSEQSSMEMFAIANKNIGFISCLKWRQATVNTQNSFLGYLLAASSNGNSYVYYVEDMTLRNDFARKSQSIDLNVYEPKKQIVLASFYSCGQCTAADWSNCNGAVQIAVGYANGSVSLFQVNSSFLSDHFTKSSREDSGAYHVYPIKTFSAHLTYISTLKWSKINGNIVATGSLFSREIKFV
jgi:hypothetical protein